MQMFFCFLLTLLPSLTAAQYGRRSQYVFSPTDPLNEKLQGLSLLGSHFGLPDIPATYDYIIVGGGTAGLTLARRLSESNTVAVIEAGGFYEFNNGNLTTVPSNVAYYLGKDPLWANPLHDWMQHTTPQRGLAGNASVLFPQGRTLGGGSARNFIWYQRSTRGAQRLWADAVGDQAYNWTSFLPFYKKSPHFTAPRPDAYPANLTPRYDPADYDASGGPLQLSFPNYMVPSGAYLSAGLTAVGVREAPRGLSGGDILGWASVVNTLDPTTQTRSSSETSMLRDTITRGFNLQVFTNALVKQVLFDNATKAAYGVNVQIAGLGSGSVTFALNATKEVILSAGAFRSPQLLMASGVGPSAALRQHGISVVADRPGVGQGMWDHIWVGITHETNVLTSASLADPAVAAAANAQYISNRTGPDTNVGGTLLAFEKLPAGAISAATRRDLDSTFGADWPDIEYFSLDAWAGNSDDFLLGAPDVRNYTSLTAALVAPFSRGSVTLATADTADHPIVDPAWLTDPRDVEVMLAGFKRVRQVFAANATKPMLVGPESYPGPNVTTDAQILEAIRRSASTVFHPAGTCRMGKTTDNMAVVDSKARVIGVKRLRVVDASAFPLLPPGHPVSTVYALAEKIAADILRGS